MRGGRGDVGSGEGRRWGWRSEGERERGGWRREREENMKIGGRGTKEKTRRSEKGGGGQGGRRGRLKKEHGSWQKSFIVSFVSVSLIIPNKKKFGADKWIV